MKSLRIIGYILMFAVVSTLLIACGGKPAVCYGDFDCTSTETCYTGQCVTIKQPGVCDSTSCPDGCCAGNVCQAQSATQCGRGGVSCADCSATNGQCNQASGMCGPKTSGCAGDQDCAAGQQCQQGACINPPPPAGCNPTTCPTGCCDATGKCQPSPGNAACGVTGGVCDNCAARGEVCNLNAGFCEKQSTTCNAGNCPDGCCDVDGKCRTSTDQLCGVKGTSCIDCGSDKQCNTGGVCQPKNSTCNANSCPNGCCAADGSCQQASNATCGLNGAACSACAGTDTCVLGSCQAPSATCDAASCPNGCCDASGKCQQYASQTDAICGKGGQACQACSANNTCSTGSCSPRPPSCSAANCPSGCCDATGKCQVNQASACGTGGGTCNVCNAGEQCTAGQCKSQGAGPYPPGPYGSSPGATIEDLALTKCGGGQVKLSDLRSQYKALLLIVSSGSS